MSADNLGMVPVPTHPLRTSGYPGMSAMGWGTGLGSNHPEAAVAWALFEGTQVRGNFPNAQLEGVFENIYANYDIFNAPSGFEDSEGNSIGSVVGPIFEAAAAGGDIASAINDARPSLERIIADTLAAMES